MCLVIVGSITGLTDNGADYAHPIPDLFEGPERRAFLTHAISGVLRPSISRIHDTTTSSRTLARSSDTGLPENRQPAESAMINNPDPNRDLLIAKAARARAHRIPPVRDIWSA